MDTTKKVTRMTYQNNEFIFGGAPDGIIDGSLTEYDNGSTTSIWKRRFDGFVNLARVNLVGITSIGEYVFNACDNLEDLTFDPATETISQYAFYNCKKVDIEELPNTITNIGQYAFYYLGSSSATGFEFTPIAAVSVGNYAFQYAKIELLGGTLSEVGQYAFGNCTSLTNVSVQINGGIGQYGFSSCANVSTFALDPNSNITNLGNYAFQSFGKSRAEPSSNVLNFDFRNSTFGTIGSYAFAGSGTGANKNTYFNIYAPQKLTTISSYAFQYSDYFNIFLRGNKVVTLSNTNAFSNATNFKICVPYTLVNGYLTAPNWSTDTSALPIKSNIVGWAEGGTFEDGDLLPEYNVEGYALTWYSDIGLTNQITTITDASQNIYCTIGSERVAVGISNMFSYNCNLSVTDGTRQYRQGDGVLVGTSLTITATPTNPSFNQFLFTVNGNEFTNGSAFVVGQDNLDIVVLYADGDTPPVEINFADNTWLQIKIGVEAGLASELWNIGDTKPVTLLDGKEVNIRLTDLQPARYTKVGGGSSSAVFEFVEILKSGTMNSSNTNTGGWEASRMRTVEMQTIYDNLPSDIQAVISTVNIESGTGGGSSSGTQTTQDKLFLPAEIEVFGTRTYSVAGEGTVFDYYDGKTANDRKKYAIGSTSASSWWERSPRSGYTNDFCYATTRGAATSTIADISYGVSPCFAI